MKDTDIVDYCINGLLITGFEKASVHFKSMEKTELNVEHNNTNLLRNAKEITLSLIGFVDQRRGVIVFNTLDEKTINNAFQEVFEIAKSSKPDPAYDISENQGRKTYQFGPQHSDLDLIYNRNQEFLEHVQANYPNVILNVNLDHSLVRHIYGNSNDINLQAKIGTYNVRVFFVTKEGQNSSSFSGTGFRSNGLEREIHEMGSISTLLQQSSEQTETLLLPEKFIGDVIITPDCFDFFQFIFREISDYPLISGTSIYKDQLNEKIADSRLTIHSHPVSQELAEGYFITDDGFEAKNTTILDKGVLKHFLLTIYGSKKTGKPIGPNRGNSYIIEPGDQSYEDMIKSVDKGILLCRFSGGAPNPSGDFSGIAKNSYYIENGQIQYPLSETMISGNIADLFQNIKNISKERNDFGSDLVPWIQVKGITVSGK
jgi:PmbA protein